MAYSVQLSPLKQLPEQVPEPILGGSIPAKPAGGPPMALYIPSCLTSLRASFEAAKDQGQRRRPRSTPRKVRPTSDTDVLYASANYLTKGGARAVERKLQSMNQAAVQDLRTTNDMLAAELVNMRMAYEEERSRLKDMNARLESDLRLAQEKLRQTSEKLESESSGKATLETQHMARLKELTKRLREEHNQKTEALAELNQQKLMVVSLGSQVADSSELRNEVARLESTVAGCQATIADLRGRLAAAESKLETDAAAKDSLQSRLHVAEAAAVSLTERSTQLATTVATLDSQLTTAKHSLQEAADELNHSKTVLQQERDSHSSLRQRAATLQAELTELQASSAMAVAQAAAEKAELERVRRELSDLRVSTESGREELSALREENLTAKSELAGYKASSESLSAECSALRQELNQVRTELTAQLVALQDSKSTEVQELRDAWSAEVAALRERTTLEVEDLRQQASTYKFQAENHEQVFLENQALATKIQRTESTLRQKEALLTEALTSHAAQLELWRSEATEVAQAASKWKQRATVLQQQVTSLESVLADRSTESSEVATRCTTLEAERSKLSEALASMEVQLSSCQQELATCKTQLKDALTAQAAAARQADSSGHEAVQRAASVDRLTARLAEETAKTSALRQDLAAITQQHVRELDNKSRMLSDLTASLAKEERAKDAAVREATALRNHLATLEKELRNAQVALSSIQDDRARSRAAYESAESALAAAESQARRYKHENKELLEQCSAWIQDVVHHQQQQQQGHHKTTVHARHSTWGPTTRPYADPYSSASTPPDSPAAAPASPHTSFGSPGSYIARYAGGRPGTGSTQQARPPPQLPSTGASRVLDEILQEAQQAAAQTPTPGDPEPAAYDGTSGSVYATLRAGLGNTGSGGDAAWMPVPSSRDTAAQGRVGTPQPQEPLSFAGRLPPTSRPQHSAAPSQTAGSAGGNPYAYSQGGRGGRGDSGGRARGKGSSDSSSGSGSSTLRKLQALLNESP